MNSVIGYRHLPANAKISRVVEGTARSHQVPMSEMAEHPEHVKMLEEWMLSDKLIEHKQCIMEYGQDMLEVRNWKWGAA